MVCEVFLEPHYVVSRRGSRAKVVLGSPQQGNPKLIVESGGPQRLLILCGNPPPKAAGSFLCYRGDVGIIGFFLAALLVVLALVGAMLWLFFLRGC